MATAIAVAACTASPATAPPSTTTAGSSPVTSGAPLATSTTQTGAGTTTSTASPYDLVALIPTAGEMAPTWVEAFVIRYGTTPDTLGTAPGGDSGSLDIGPQYGTQTADGTWWFLDGAKQRIAHFSEAGEYIDQIPVPQHLLVDGEYFQFQIPKALDDGSIVAVGFRELGTALLTIAGEAMSERHVPGFLVPRVTDGSHLYLSDTDGDLLRLVPSAFSFDPVEWLVTRAGRRYWITIDDDTIVVQLPDLVGYDERRLPMRWADKPGSPVHAGIQVDSGVDGSLFVFLYGAPDVDPSVQVTGFLTVSPDGAVSPVEATIDPFSPSDPGSPSQLGVRPGTSDPWLMFVLEDGVHVYTRESKGEN